MTGPVDPTITVEAPKSKNNMLGIVCAEVWFLTIAIHAFSGENLWESTKLLLVMLRVLSMGGAMYFFMFAPEITSQSLSGTRFLSMARYKAADLNLLEQPDLTMRVHPDGNLSITYWSEGGEQRLRVLPDPSGRMREALMEVGRLLPPGRFVDERQATLEGAK